MRSSSVIFRIFGISAALPGAPVCFLWKQAGSIFFTDYRYDTQAHEEVKGAKVVIARKSVFSSLGEFLGGRRKRARGWAIGIEAEHFTVAEKKRLNRLRPPASI